MFNFHKKEDSKIQSDVMSELAWDPRVTSTEINVTAKDGVVTLRGTVPHYFEKSNAEEAAQRVAGVRGVADEIEVNLLGNYERSDEDINKAALNALDWSYEAPEGVKVSVAKGWVTLRGEAEWDFERNAAKEAVRSLMGVRGVFNEIKIKSKIQPSDVKNRIEEALKRSAENEARKINVTVSGNRVKLSGNVHSLSDLGEARLAAWNAPGVMMVEDTLKIAV